MNTIKREPAVVDKVTKKSNNFTLIGWSAFNKHNA